VIARSRRPAHGPQPGGGQLGGGYDDPDVVVGVPAGELMDWAWLVGHLGQWLTAPGEPTVGEYTDQFPAGPDLPGLAWMLEAIGERIAALLDGDRGQP